MLVRKIWKFSRRIRMTQMKKEGGRVGEALDRVGPESRDSGRPDLPKREDSTPLTPAFRGPAKAGKAVDHPAPIQGPKHPTVLITNVTTS